MDSHSLRAELSFTRASLLLGTARFFFPHGGVVGLERWLQTASRLGCRLLASCSCPSPSKLNQLSTGDHSNVRYEAGLHVLAVLARGKWHGLLEGDNSSRSRLLVNRHRKWYGLLVGVNFRGAVHGWWFGTDGSIDNWMVSNSWEQQSGRLIDKEHCESPSWSRCLFHRVTSDSELTLLPALGESWLDFLGPCTQVQGLGIMSAGTWLPELGACFVMRVTSRTRPNHHHNNHNHHTGCSAQTRVTLCRKESVFCANSSGQPRCDGCTWS